MRKQVKLDGKPIRDARKSVVLHITEDDVKKGNRKAPDCCAAALACKRHFGADYAMAHLSRVYIDLGEIWLRFTTPISLRHQIVAFDHGKSFAPGGYTLGAISPSMRTGKSHASQGTHPHLGSDKGVSHPTRGRRSKPIRATGVRVSASTKLMHELEGRG